MPILAERYQLDGLFYSDAWVVAYRARDQLLSRDVTVELLRPERAGPDTDERLLAKGRRAARTSLPHVAAIYDQATVNGRPFLVLEEPIGPALADAVPLPPARAVALVESLAHTQRSALRHGQTIPALTPWTVRLAGDGRVQVMVLGLDQEQPLEDTAVRQLGTLLATALGPATAGHSGRPGSAERTSGRPAVPELREIAARAAGGEIASLDELLSLLRSADGVPAVASSDPAGDPTVHEASTVRVHASPVYPMASRTGTARAYASVDAPTAPLRRTRGGGTAVFLVPLAVLLVAAIGAVLASGAAEDAAPSSAPAPSVVASVAQSAAPTPSVPAAATAAVSPAAETYVVAAIGSPPQLRLREGPGLHFRRIAGLPNGTIVQRVDEQRTKADGYTWVRVRAGQIEGWCILEGLRRP